MKRSPLSRRPKKDAQGRTVLIATVALIFLAGGYGIYSVVNDNAVPRRRVMEVVALRIIEPPPPPPKVEPPPEPPKVIEEQIIEPPVDMPDDAPPNDAPAEGPIGLDAQGGAGGDAFGLAARPGGRDFLLGSNTGGGGGSGNRFGRYATLIQSQIDKSLREDEMLETARFRTTMRIWLSAAGTIEKVELVRTTGDNALDQRIARVISTMPAIPEAPPSEMPQPVIVRIGATPGFG